MMKFRDTNFVPAYGVAKSLEDKIPTHDKYNGYEREYYNQSEEIRTKTSGMDKTIKTEIKL